MKANAPKRTRPLPFILGIAGILIIVVIGAVVLRALLAEKVIGQESLPNLVLKASDVPPDLNSGSPQPLGSSNEEFANSFGVLQTSSPAQILKQLNDLGRIIDAGFSYEPTATDLCQYTNGPYMVNGKVDLFRSVKGAQQAFDWGKTFEGFYWTGLAGQEKLPEIGEQSWYGYDKGTQPISTTCSAHRNFYRLFFQRANTNVWLQIFILDTSLPDDAVKKLIINYGKIIDQRIIAYTR